MKQILLSLLILLLAGHAKAGEPVAIGLRTTATYNNMEAHMAPYGSTSSRPRVTALGITSQVLAFTGGALIGWPVGTAIGGGEPEWMLALVGAGLVAVAIPLAIIAKKQSDRMGYTSGGHQPPIAGSSRSKSLQLSAGSGQLGFNLQF